MRVTNSAQADPQKVILKRYLSQYFMAKERQRIYRDRLEEIQRELRGPLQQLPGAAPRQGGRCLGPGASTDLAAKLSEIEERINRQVEIEATAILDVMKMLDFLPADSTERAIMDLRHIDCKPWNEIMKQVHLSRSPCFMYYEKGLQRLLRYKKVQKSLAIFEAKIQRAEKDGY